MAPAAESRTRRALLRRGPRPAHSIRDEGGAGSVLAEPHVLELLVRVVIRGPSTHWDTGLGQQALRLGAILFALRRPPQSRLRRPKSSVGTNASYFKYCFSSEAPPRRADTRRSPLIAATRAPRTRAAGHVRRDDRVRAEGGARAPVNHSNRDFPDALRVRLTRLHDPRMPSWRAVWERSRPPPIERAC